MKQRQLPGRIRRALDPVRLWEVALASDNFTADTLGVRRFHRVNGWSRLMRAFLALLLAGILLGPLVGRGETARQVGMEVIVVTSLDLAREIQSKLRAGADFALLASEHSIDASASKGGYFGMVDPETLRPELRDAVRDLRPGQFSEVVKIPSGYAILKILRGQPNASTVPQSKPGPQATGMNASGSGADWRPTLDTSGYGAFLGAVLKKRGEIPRFGQDLQEVCLARRQAPNDAVASLERLLESSEAPRDHPQLANMLYTAALFNASQGRIDKAIDQWEKSYSHAVAAPGDMPPGMEEAVGVAYMRRVETEGRPSPDADNEGWLIPTHPGALHPRSGDVQNAIAYFTRGLRADPFNLELRWLLNVAYMAAGTYPAAVPAPYLIPPSVFTSKDDIGKFRDVGQRAGVSIVGEAGGVIVDDFDNDGLLDIVVSQVDDCEPLRFFHNNGDGTFTDRTAQAGLSNQTGGLNIIQTDYNNDGCLDILVLRGGWEFPRRRSLLRNNCDGTFTDVTAESGLLEPQLASQAAVWTDIDNDGNLDLFIANENGPAQLFLNKGDGTFIDISKEAGVDRIAFSKGVVAADYDNDGYPDLYVANQNGQGFLYHNNGDRTFTDITAAAGIHSPRFSFVALFFDYDNDGWPDLFITTYFASVEESVRSYLSLPLKGETQKLYKNLGNGTFRDVTAEVGLDRIFMPMGCNFGDVDNDGFLDIYMGTGSPAFSALLPSVLLRNKDGRHFEDISTSSGTGALAKGHGIAFADFRNDGEQDIFANLGGAELGDQYPSRLFRNPGGHGNTWITLKLVGAKTNRAAIGARITVTVNDADRGLRKIVRTVGSGGSFGASPLEQHIGLGRSARIENIEVWWPTSKTRQTFKDIAPNQFLEIKEFTSEVTRRTRSSFDFGGSSSTNRGLASLPH